MIKPGTDQAQRLQRAQETPAASQAATDHATYANHLGALEVRLEDMIRLVEALTGDA